MRKYLIGVIAGLVGAVALSSVASADVTGLSITSPVNPTKQDKKVRGGVSTVFTSTDTHAGFLPCPPETANTLGCYAYPPSVQSVITFPRDFKFNPGNLPDCNLASLLGKSTAAARAACPRSIVGGGTNVQAFSDGTTRNGVVTAFNGAPSAGNPSLYVHVEFPGIATKPILNGVIRGTVLTLQIPPVEGSVIEQFSTAINRIVTQKKRNKKTGKVQKTFYLSARCSTGTWTETLTATYLGGKTLTASYGGKCKQKRRK